MSDKKIIFKTGEIIYPDEWYVKNNIPKKPVLYTHQFLKEIAESTKGSSLELTHGNTTNDVVGFVNEFELVEDELMANVVTNESTEQMGYSPEFGVDFKDLGEKYEAVNGELLKTILTDKPRSHILCNSIEGGSNMGDDKTIDILNKRISELERENNKLERKIEANKEKVEQFDKLSSQVNELTKANESLTKELEGLKPKAEAYSKFENKQRADLLEKVFGNNEDAKKAFAEESIENLQLLAEQKQTTVPATGVGAGSAEGVGAGDGTDGELTPEEKLDKKADDAIAYFKEINNGETPSFLNIEGGE
jgi:outer membrane murein-binding lipoprotein Lpp